MTTKIGQIRPNNSKLKRKMILMKMNDWNRIEKTEATNNHNKNQQQKKLKRKEEKFIY